jgi:mutator protein MutT
MKPFIRIIVGAIIRKGKKVLLTKEILENGSECWIFPGGEVRFGESLEEAIKREIKEELGMEIKVEKLMDFKEAIFPERNSHVIIFFFLAKPCGNFSVNKKEILDARYFNFEEIENLNLANTDRWAFERLKSLKA